MENIICPIQNDCALLHENGLLHALLFNIKVYYCKTNFKKCARYQLYQQNAPIPSNLLPNQKTYPLSTVKC